MARFFVCVFRVGKMRLRHSAQRQVELRRLGNQLPVLGKANSLWKIVKCCVFCLFVKMRLGPGIKISRVVGYRSSGKIHLASRRCTTVPVAPPGGGGKCELQLFTLFRLLCPAFSFADVDTYASNVSVSCLYGCLD